MIIMMSCPESTMSIDNAAWHLSRDKAAGFVTLLVLKRKRLELKIRGITRKKPLIPLKHESGDSDKRLHIHRESTPASPNSKVCIYKCKLEE